MLANDTVLGLGAPGAGVVDGACRSARLPAEAVIKKVSTMPFPTEWKRCAIVGSSGNLHGKSLGAEIDAHDTVIRMNRVPTSQFFSDMGARTDIYFKNLLSDFTAAKTRVQYLGVKEGSDKADWCVHKTKQGCPFGAVLYEGASLERQRTLGWLASRGWALPYAYQTDELHKAEHSFAMFGLERKWPSAGFKVLMTAAMMCDSIALYGFGGDTVVDGHHLAHNRHELAAEHAFMHRLSKGEDIAPDLAQRPILEFGEPDPRFAATLRERLECLGKHGGFTIRGAE